MKKQRFSESSGHLRMAFLFQGEWVLI